MLAKTAGVNSDPAIAVYDDDCDIRLISGVLRKRTFWYWFETLRVPRKSVGWARCQNRPVLSPGQRTSAYSNAYENVLRVRAEEQTYALHG